MWCARVTDVTVVAVGHLVHEALSVADELASEISIEVFDPRTVYPFDWRGLAASVGRTGRLVVIDDTNRFCGFGAEIVSTAAEELTTHRTAPAGHPARGRGTAVRPGAGPRGPAAQGPTRGGGAGRVHSEREAFLTTARPAAAAPGVSARRTGDRVRTAADLQFAYWQSPRGTYAP